VETKRRQRRKSKLSPRQTLGLFLMAFFIVSFIATMIWLLWLINSPAVPGSNNVVVPGGQ
jgi:hypothetical protein